jgi:glycosyltransferase involved in cell wall biosynthesis
LLKIAQVSPTYYPSIGGVESYVQAVSERLVKRGFEVDVITTDSTGSLPKRETWNGVGIHRFKSWAPGNAYYFSPDLRAFLRKNSLNYEVIHAHNYHALPALYASQAKAGNKLVFTPHYHGGGHTLFRRALHIPWKYYARRIFDNSDRIVCVSEFERNLLIKNFGIEPSEAVLVPGGVDLEEFKALGLEKTADLPNMQRILCVSRLEKYKGIQYLLRCLFELQNDFVLEVVGSGTYKQNLERQAAKLRVSGRVRFFEDLSREQLLARYRNATVFVLLSKYEAFSIVMAEALASGLPCIVSRTAALAEWIDNESCFGIDYPINIKELSGLVIKVSRTRVVRRNGLMGWSLVADKMADLYSNLVP